MHSTGSMKSWSTASNPGRPSSYCVALFGWMQSTGQASTHAVSFVPMQGSAMIYAIVPSQNCLSLQPIPHRHGGCVRQRLNYPTQDHDVVINRGEIDRHWVRMSFAF